MYIVKKAKHRCGTAGCGEARVHLLAKTKDYRGSVYLCDKCLEEFYRSVFGNGDKTKPKEKSAEVK